MEKMVASLYDELQNEINQLTDNSENRLHKMSRSYELTVLAIQKLKSNIIEHEFRSKDEEKRFFKVVLPKLLKESVYYYELKNLELGIPVGGVDARKNYYHQALDAIAIFFKNNQDLFNYWRMARSDLDEMYFIRGKEDEFRPEIDSRFCTAKCYELARIFGMYAVRQYLMNELCEMDLPAPGSTNKEVDQMVWTDAKVKLIELGYALKFRGSINNGRVSISKIMAYIGQKFGVDLSNHEVVYHQNIRLRKRKTRTIYLHELIDSMESAMDYIDENPR